MTIYGNADKNTCASCSHYKFEGEHEKCKCSNNRTSGYYYPWDSCKYWEEASDWYRDKRPLQR